MEAAKKLNPYSVQKETVYMNLTEVEPCECEAISLVKCQICSSETTVREFKEKYICEACVQYIKSSF